jgi:c-di-GMP-binding flagellar brake protein YcgR
MLMVNKRKYLRVTIKAMAEIVCVEDGRNFGAFVGGISRGGLEIYSEEPISKGAHLRITITFIDKHGKPQQEEVSGEVRWAAPFNESHIGGIEFSQPLSEDQNPRLADYVQNSEEYVVR